LRSSLRIQEPDNAQRVTSDGRLWSEVAAALEALAARCAERGYITDRLVLTGSGTDAKDTWRVELITTERHRAEAEVARQNVPVVPPPERYVISDSSKLSDKVVREFLLLTCGEDTAAGMERARRELSESLRTAGFSRVQNNGFELWRAKGRSAKRGAPRWRFLVSQHRLCRVLPEHDGAGKQRRRPPP